MAWKGLRDVSTKYLIFQSDDWGFCGWSPNVPAWKTHRLLGPNPEGEHYWGSTLESPLDLHRLFDMLEEFRDGVGLSVPWVANYILCRPDFQRMRDEGFSEWRGVELPEVPAVWERGNIIAAAKEGVKRGVWAAPSTTAIHIATFRCYSTCWQSGMALRGIVQRTDAGRCTIDRFIRNTGLTFAWITCGGD